MSSASSSAAFFGIREDEFLHELKPPPQPLPVIPHQASSVSPVAAAQPSASAPVKKKRNLPGVTAPDAEVIALSPRTLLATNRFICEVCNKGFQREQNLQLHRRGHNLPWKLRQKSTKEVRRRMYLCPEPTCVHHDPSRALGDLTGIKKHFCRKHGEKKWKCDKCSKHYAVQSDLKAHSKTCGTREYRCDCGTLFSRRDSFITHRAFCDALAQENARLPTGLTALGNHLYGTNPMALNLSQANSLLKPFQNPTQPSPNLLRLGGTARRSHFENFINSQQNPTSLIHTTQPHNPSPFYIGSTSSSQDFSHDLQSKPNFHGLMQLPDLQSNAPTGSNSPTSAAAANLFNLNFYSNNGHATHDNNSGNQNNHLFMSNDQFNNVNNGGCTDANTIFSNTLMKGVNSLYNESGFHQMSATEILQKAAEMGSKPATDYQASFGNNENNQLGYSRAQMENEIQLQGLMNSLANGNAASGLFGGQEHDDNNGGFRAFNSAGMCNIDGAKFGLSSCNANNLGVSDRLTRDFLGVGSMVRGINGGILSEQHDHHQYGNIEHLGSFDSDIKKAQLANNNNARSFAGVGGGSMC